MREPKSLRQAKQEALAFMKSGDYASVDIIVKHSHFEVQPWTWEHCSKRPLYVRELVYHYCLASGKIKKFAY